MRKLSTSIAIMVALLAASPAYAFGGSGVTVTGYCKSTGFIASEASLMSVSSQIATLQGTLATQLHLIGSSIASQEGALISTIDSQFKNENNQIRHSANAARIGQIKAQQALAMAPNQQPQNMCDAPGLGAGIQVGSQTNADLTQKIAAASNSHDTTFTRPIDADAAVMKAPSTVFGPAPPFVPGGSLSPAQSGIASQWINADTAPYPLPAIPATSNPSPSAMRYDAAVRVDTARLAVPQETEAMIVALHTASLNVGTWPSDTWAAMTDKSGGVPPGVVNGHISDNALTRLQVAARYANPSWYAGLATKNTEGLLREVALMDAVRMHMQYTELRLTERMAMMISQMAAQQANRAARQDAGVQG
ncbi:MAG: hypothetical protein M0Z68_03380 [Gammaproteobacteria bacterium]|nr:hypothetical protein [Gammaproteobacteria bacterium]